MYRYAFHDQSWPSIEDIIRRLQSDNTVASDERNALMGDLDWLVNEAAHCPRFENCLPAHMPFARPVIAGILRQATARHTPAEIRKIRAGLDAALARYRLNGPAFIASMHPDWVDLHAGCTGYQGRDLQRPLIFLSTRGIGREQVSSAFADNLLVAMTADPTLLHPTEAWTKGLRAWNWARSHVEGFPDVALRVPTIRPEPKYLPWSGYRDGLKDEVEAALKPKPGFVTWDKKVADAYAPDPDGLAHGIELIRICIGALVFRHKHLNPSANVIQRRDGTHIT